MTTRPVTALRGTERQIAELLTKHEVLTRQELAKLSSLPLTTITGAAARLRARGLLEEVRLGDPSTPQRPGRPATGLRLSRQDSLAGVVVITHRVVRAALVSSDGQLSGRVEKPWAWLQCPDIVAECRYLLAEARQRAGDAASLGHVVLGLPVPFKAGAGLSLLEPVSGEPREPPPAVRWLFRDVAPELGAAFGVPATVDNECNLAALGELTFGAARGRRHMIYLKLVTGMGAGLVVNGELVHGANGLAGELSHLHVDPAGPMCGCGARGCLGTVATADHILDAARPLFGPQVNIYDILGLAAQGDAAVRRVLEDVGRLIGTNLAPACVLLNPEMIVIDGTLGPAAASLLDGLRDELRRHMPTGTFRALTLTLGQLGDSAELAGAARLLSSREHVQSSR